MMASNQNPATTMPIDKIPDRHTTADKCATCRLELRAGETHANADACVDALREELDAAMVCPGCEGPMEVCAKCVTKAFVTKKAGEGLFAILNKISTDAPARKPRTEREPAPPRRTRGPGAYEDRP